jgi:hypothetical protein
MAVDVLSGDTEVEVKHEGRKTCGRRLKIQHFDIIHRNSSDLFSFVSS